MRSFADDSGSLSQKTAGAPIYDGAIAITDPALGVNYNDGIRLVTISVNWTNRGMLKRREISTYISRYGVNKVH